VDDSPSRSEPAKKKRKKRANRRQKSRGIREFTGDRRRIIEKAYLFLQKALAIHIPWPVASESGDPSADDDEFQILIEDAWAEAIEFLELDPEDFDEISLDESNPVSFLSYGFPALTNVVDSLAHFPVPWLRHGRSR
jgi:hypothetical protein